MVRIGEPKFSELLADPMIRLVMASDRVSEGELCGIADAARERIMRQRRSSPTPVRARALDPSLRKPH